MGEGRGRHSTGVRGGLVVTQGVSPPYQKFKVHVFQPMCYARGKWLRWQANTAGRIQRHQRSRHWEGIAWDQIDSDMGSNRYMLLIMIWMYFRFWHLCFSSVNSLTEFMTNCVVWRMYMCLLRSLRPCSKELCDTEFILKSCRNFTS